MLKNKKEKKKKRDLEKYPALNPKLNARTRFDVLDMDYLKKLDEEDLKFLNQFMAEYVSGAFKKNEDGNYSDENFHKTLEERRECYNRNNTRNRCGLTISNAKGTTLRTEDISSYIDLLTEVESQINNILSDTVIDEYDGDYDKLEIKILTDMYNDYQKCINPKTNADKKLAESNYGKSLILKFKNV